MAVEHHPAVSGCLLVSTGRMQGVTFDPHRQVARVQAGVKWAKVVEAATEY